MAYIGNSPSPIGNFSATTHNGGTAVFTMGQSPGTKNAVLVFIDGVRQDPLNYSVAGTTLTLGTAAPAGTDNVQILVSGEELSVNVPADDSIAVDALDTTSAGTTGQFLTKSGASTIDWATVDALPSQTSQSGKFLTTDGSTASWGNEIPTQTGQSGKYLTTDGSATNWGTVATTDTTNIEADIALLGFKVAINGDMGKYNLVDQTEDAFVDATGVDATLSVNELRNAAKYYSGSTSITGTGYGFAGGTSQSAYTHAGGGGGGSAAVGGNATAVNVAGGGGGARGNDWQTGATQYYGGGGAGGIWSGSTGSPGTNAGAGGVGNGVAGNATDGFGGGGGGFGGNSAIKGAGDGGNGVVVVRYTSGSDLATGGTITTVGGDKVHTFSAGGNFVTTSSITAAKVLLVGGGGAGGQYHAGGGGGGGVLEITSIDLGSGITFPVTVGQGATGKTRADCGISDDGTNSTFNTNNIAVGGGGAGTWCGAGSDASTNGRVGGSGGGAAGGGSSLLGGGASNQTGPGALISNMTLVSNSTAAETEPTNGNIVLTYTDGSGTATVNTDIKAYCSRDNGGTYTQMTLASQGTTGGHTILSANSVNISGQPSGSAMRYKIETLSQSGAKETRIQAVSLGWS